MWRSAVFPSTWLFIALLCFTFSCILILWTSSSIWPCSGFPHPWSSGDGAVSSACSLHIRSSSPNHAHSPHDPMSPNENIRLSLPFSIWTLSLSYSHPFAGCYDQSLSLTQMLGVSLIIRMSDCSSISLLLLPLHHTMTIHKYLPWCSLNSIMNNSMLLWY